ncbi:unnamed protein product [Linum tenue]|uniref:Uncharacterized protein n=1 Tax=Linum tenue TaxID=586396 RepID=A0AAV0QYG1_9ROSI|nr:unnamed protein product [Linum tenue]
MTKQEKPGPTFLMEDEKGRTEPPPAVLCLTSGYGDVDELRRRKGM